MTKKILLLGDQDLYKTSEEVKREELKEVESHINDLHDTLVDFRKKYKAGRAIALPQIGVFKRVVYMYINTPVVFINPVLEFEDNEQMELLDDCMSFPNLLVKVKRYKRCIIKYKDINWKDCIMELEGDLSELLQHEYDHLNGILAVMRAIDNKSFYMKEHVT